MKILQSNNGSQSKNLLKRFFHLGLRQDLPDYLYAQGLVFNILNFTGLICAIIRFFYVVVFLAKDYSTFFLVLNFMPVLLCITMIALMYKRAYVSTVYFSFGVFPAMLLTMGLYTGDRGVLFYLFPYMIYPFFFLNSRRKVMLTFTLTALLFITGFIIEMYRHKRIIHTHDTTLELISLSGAFLLAAVSLYSIKFQLWRYQDKVMQQKNEIEAQRLTLENSNRIKDKVFSIISHDLKAPLQSLYLMFEYEENPAEHSKLLQEMLPELKTELKKTSDLFDNLLNWARLQIMEASVNLVQTNVASLTSMVTENLSKRAAEKGILIQQEVSEATITADKDILEIVLRNLVSNAIKFSGKNDVITISGKKKKGFFEIGVSDTGVGITADNLSKIESSNFFTSYGTQHEKGTGLGLIICRDLVAKCSGNLSIQSEFGKGTHVSVLLPV